MAASWKRFEVIKNTRFDWCFKIDIVIGFRLEAAGPWMVENRDAWKGSPEEELILKVMTKDDGEEYEFGDRRQQLVFIGIGLNHVRIQQILDQCLLTDEEMDMKPFGWFEKWDNISKIK